MKHIAAALIELHKKLPSIHQDTKGNYAKYAKIQVVHSTVNPVLGQVGLAVPQTFDSIDGEEYLITTLIHIESGESIQSKTKLLPAQRPGDLNQDWGKSVTFKRRYALLSILGISAGMEDSIDMNNPDEHVISTPSSAITTKPQRIAPKKLSKVEKENGLNFVKAWVQENPEGFEKMKVAYGTAFPDFNDMEKPSFNLHVLFPMHLEFLKDFIETYV